MDLLIAARQIQSDRFDSGRVAKEGGMWIVKRDMSILSNPHTNDVYRKLTEQSGISLALCRNILCRSVQIVHRLEWYTAHNMLPQVRSKFLRGLWRQTNIFIHVKGIYSLPFDVWTASQCF